MLNYTEDDVKVGGIKIHYYRTAGRKQPFVLLHGATDNGLCWTPVAEILTAKYDVIMVPFCCSDKYLHDFCGLNSTIT
jgi:N-formylmaleamate deformylase